MAKINETCPRHWCTRAYTTLLSSLISSADASAGVSVAATDAFSVDDSADGSLSEAVELTSASVELDAGATAASVDDTASAVETGLDSLDDGIEAAVVESTSAIWVEILADCVACSVVAGLATLKSIKFIRNEESNRRKSKWNCSLESVR